MEATVRTAQSGYIENIIKITSHPYTTINGVQIHETEAYSGNTVEKSPYAERGADENYAKYQWTNEDGKDHWSVINLKCTRIYHKDEE